MINVAIILNKVPQTSWTYGDNFQVKCSCMNKFEVSEGISKFVHSPKMIILTIKQSTKQSETLSNAKILCSFLS